MSASKRNRVTLLATDSMVSEIERIVTKVNAKYGVRLGKTDALRIGTMVFIRGGLLEMLDSQPPNSILSIGDIERVFVEHCRANILKKEEA
jgi:hypothetical protein